MRQRRKKPYKDENRARMKTHSQTEPREGSFIGLLVPRVWEQAQRSSLLRKAVHN